MYLVIISLFLLFAITYLSGFFDRYKALDLSYYESENQSNIEYLTQHKTKTKNYGRPPGKFTTFNKLISGQRIKDDVHFRYEVPLIENIPLVYQCTMTPQQISPLINMYGVEQQYIIKESDDTVTINNRLPETSLRSHFISGSWYYNNTSDWGVDYARLVSQHLNFTESIAFAIYNELIKNGKDTYHNRVQAALNFIQFIPYGLPQFDTHQWYYHELSIPAESFILGYADCDSKSVFFASILCHLVPSDNIILVACTVKSQSDKTSGAHMMAAVSGLNLAGENVFFNNKNYLLLETTTPCIMGKSDWETLVVNQIFTVT